MSTRGKLILLVIITCLANASSLLIDRLMTRPIRSIQVETEYLQNMLDGLLMYSAQVNRLDSESFRDQTERVIETREALDGLFSDVSGARMLPELNETIQTSLEGFLVYQNDIEMAHQSLFNQSEMIVATADRLIGKDKPFTLDSLLAASEDEDDEVMLSVTRLASIAFVVDGTITKARTDLETQYRIISDEVLVMERRANRLVLVIILLVFVFSFAIALIIANVLAGRIKKIEIGISRMKEGDLADRIEIHSRDEMGRLSRNVNDFTKALGKSMLRIKDTSGRNIAIKEQLLSSVQNVNEVTSTVGASAHSISAEMTGLDGTVGIGTEAVQTVKDRLVRLEEVIQEEVSMIEETSAAITQMIASVSTVGDITTRKKNSMAQLVELATSGGGILKNTNGVISKVHDSVEEIRESVDIIDDIASRTNLLAMNAAIEAAHAGDSGKGFAVVAGEIRNLAEATAQNSRRIDGIMATVIENIEEAVKAGQETGEMFHQIDSEVNGAFESFDEIAGSMQELKIGSSQILEAMARLTEFSGRVKADGSAMGEAAEANLRGMEDISRISGIAAEKVNEISSALDGLKAEMNAVAELSRKADTVSETLEQEVAVFHIEAEVLK